jgi:hypothetical protein
LSNPPQDSLQNSDNDKPEQGKPETDWPGVDQPDVNRPEVDQPELDRPGLDVTEADVKEVDVSTPSVVRAHEVEDIQILPLALFGAAIVAVVVSAHIVLWWAMQRWSGEELRTQLQIPPAITTPAPAPGPGLQAAPAAELRFMLGREAEILNHYGWVDRDAGTVRIPIEQAMQLLLERGLPAQAGETPDFGLAPAHRMDSSGGLAPVTGAPANGAP